MRIEEAFIDLVMNYDSQQKQDAFIIALHDTRLRKRLVYMGYQQLYYIFTLSLRHLGIYTGTKITQLVINWYDKIVVHEDDTMDVYVEYAKESIQDYISTLSDDEQVTIALTPELACVYE